jgi:hypothetical protein
MREFKTQFCRLGATARITVLVAACAAGSLAHAQDSNKGSDENNKDSTSEVKPLDASLHADIGERPKVDDQDTRGARQHSAAYSRWGFQPTEGTRSRVFWPKQSATIAGTENSGNRKNRSIVTDDAFKAAPMPPELRSWQGVATGLESSAPDKAKEERTKRPQPEGRWNGFALDRNLDHNEDQTHGLWNVVPFHQTTVPLSQQRPVDSALKPFHDKSFAQSGTFLSTHPFGECHRTNHKSGAAAEQHKHSLPTKPNGLKPTNPIDRSQATKP